MHSVPYTLAFSTSISRFLECLCAYFEVNGTVSEGSVSCPPLRFGGWGWGASSLAPPEKIPGWGSPTQNDARLTSCGGPKRASFSPKSGQKWPNFSARAKGARGIPQSAYNRLQIGSNFAPKRLKNATIAPRVSMVAQKRPHRLKYAENDPKVR